MTDEGVKILHERQACKDALRQAHWHSRWRIQNEVIVQGARLLRATVWRSMILSLDAPTRRNRAGHTAKNAGSLRST